MKNNDLLVVLGILITLDYATTYIGVLYLGATELNPFYKYFPNLYYWFMFKFMAGVFCLGTLAFIDNDQNINVIKIGLILLILLYFIVVINNLLQIGIEIGSQI